ncbi:MAG: hypothetical protein P4L35_18245 [Ignavibacteriaceae bacterium]|nr:hypothetical protein [Ignavibacteriaceae bacterium]
MKVTFVERQYENKVFPKGQFRQFALKLARFCNLSITVLFILIHRKGDDFETSTISTVDDLMNICEIGKTISCLAFHSSFNIIKFRLQLYSNALNITYNIKGDLENAKHIIFLTENILELTRLSEQGTGELPLDNSRHKKDIIETVRSIEPSVEEIIVRVGRCQSDEATNKQEFLEIEDSLFDLMKQVYDRVTENSVGSFDNYFNQVIRSRCQERIDDY